MNQGIAYLASPYSRCADLDRAFQQVGAIAYHLSSAGVSLFCPIVHAYAMARAAGQDPKNPAIYEALNRRMLDVCARLIVAQMDGWLASNGMLDEILFFERMHKPIFDLDPQTMVMKRRRETSAEAKALPLIEAELVQK